MQFDCGWDIADYTAVDPQYGTLQDFHRFLEGCHQRIRLILTWCLTIPSHLHQWFQKVVPAAATLSDRRWKTENGAPPNNWNSAFGGSAWEHDAQTDQYYYHFFLKEQPDLNWRNPAVKAAMFDAARFWLKMGVDGFRLDALGTIFENPDLPDHPVPFDQVELGRKFMQAETDEDRKTHAILIDVKYQVNSLGSI
jgi:alpha-glucosidase